MFLIRLYSVILSGIAGISAAAFQEPPIPSTQRLGHVDLNDFPRIHKDCVQTAKMAAEKFRQRTKVRLWQVTCDDHSKAGFNIRIAYFHERLLREIQLPSSHFTIEYPGVFRSYAECESELSAQTAKFIQYTKVEPVFAYCRRGFFLQDSAPYFIQFYAYGTGEFRPFLMTGLLGSAEPVGDQANLVAEIEGKLRELNFPGVKVAITSNQFSSWRLKIYYYGISSNEIDLLQKLTYGSAEECIQSIGEVREALQKSGAKPLSVFCSNLGGARLNILLLASERVEIFHSPEPYSSRADCEAMKSEIVRYYREILKWDVRGAVCNGEGNNHGLHIFRYLADTEETTK